ncbi:MAG: hypothetical protein ACYDDU_06580 [Dermatophilaceae bacterium]
MCQIQPGDLVLYFGDCAHHVAIYHVAICHVAICHVAIYAVTAKMVSASNPDDGVELIDFLAPWFKERFGGVGRMIA